MKNLPVYAQFVAHALFIRKFAKDSQILVLI